MNDQATSDDVKQANRELYDAVAESYEEIDGRRTDNLRRYLQDMLRTLRDTTQGGALLDLGCGTGFLSACGEGIFDRRVGVDISPRILEAGKSNFDEFKAGDVDEIPYLDASFDVVACFAVLHHLSETSALASEVTRVLKPGGVFYTDHDMDDMFYRRFRVPLNIYRRIRGAEQEYESAGVDAEDYALAEIKENGIDTTRLITELEESGLSTCAEFHWYGLTGPTDRVFGRRLFSRGWAPLARVTGIKSL